MTKYSYSLLVCCVLLFSGCQSIEQLSIDYMLPAEVSFPSALRRVAVINNMPPIPDNKLILEENDEKKKDETEIARKTRYFNGDAQIATESLAEALANENYFEGGYHPMGYIGIGESVADTRLNPDLFFDIQSDKSLKYQFKQPDK